MNTLSLKYDILERLRAGGYVSGQSLAGELGKSRAAVWKAVAALRKEGYPVSAHAGMGYILDSESDVLSEAELSRFCPKGLKIFCYDGVDSTNAQARRLIGEGCEGAFLVAAASQTAGRGRLGRSFYSPDKTGLYMSLAAPLDIPLEDGVFITTAAAAAVCRALEAETGLRCGIKWVNDIYLGGKKVCGILTQSVSELESGRLGAVIIGVGVNISTADFPPEVENGGSLGVFAGRARLAGRIARELLCVLESGCPMDYYRSRSIVLGKNIKYLENGEWHTAFALAVDDRGGLVVRLTGGAEKTLRSGEISVRAL